MKRFLALPILFVLSACSVDKAPATSERIDVSAAETRIMEGAQVLDVRTQEEWDQGHLKNAIRVDFKQDGFVPKAQAALDESKPVVVYCRSGNRSAKATALLEDAGFTTLYDMQGGITAWTAAGKPVVTD